MAKDNETLVIESSDSIKSIEVKDGLATVGAYAIRFSGPDQKDLQGEYFTPETYLGSRKGDGADVLFNHGLPPTKAFDEICDRVFGAAKATCDAVGVFVEHVLNLADEYEAAIADLCAQGRLKWSSGATSHMVRRTDTGEIKRWPIAEFSYTPTPAEPRLPAIVPLKSVTIDDATAAELETALDAKAVWSTAYVNNLPDSAFLYVESGGKKDSDGKTVPRTLRHFPYKDASGNVDMPHLRNALARIPQSNLPASVKDKCTSMAQGILKKTAPKSVDLESVAVDNKAQSEPQQISQPIMTPEEIAAKKAADEKALNERFEAKAKEISEIFEIGNQINDRELASKFVKEGKSLDEFRAHVLENVLKAKPVNPNDALIGLDEKQTKTYSMLKAIRDLVTKGRLEGLEKDAHDMAVKTYGREVDGKGFIVPEDIRRGFGRRMFKNWKANAVSPATAGGFLVDTDIGPMIELLRNRPRVIEAGATQLNGLTGDLALPVQTAGSTAYWVAETGALTASSATFSQKKLTPHRLGASIPYSTQFIAQASVDAEALIRDDAVRVLAIEIDRASLLGIGAAGEPLGVANTASIATTTYSGAATWAKVVDSETQVATGNADIGSMAFLLDAATVGKWKSIARASTYPLFLIADDMTANGYPVYRTNNLSSAHQSFFGVWSQLLLASWAGMSVIVDPYGTNATSGQVTITFNEFRDVLVRQPAAFCVSTDTAAA